MPTALVWGSGPWQHRGFYYGGVAARTDLWGRGGGAWVLTVVLFMGSALVSCCLPLWIFCWGGKEEGGGQCCNCCWQQEPIVLIQVLWWAALSHSEAPLGAPPVFSDAAGAARPGPCPLPALPPPLEVRRGPALCGHLCQDPLPPLKFPSCVWNPPWTRVLSSWARSGSARAFLVSQPPAPLPLGVGSV